jgi:hypothetical protein
MTEAKESKAARILREDREALTKRREELTAELATVDDELMRISRYFGEPAKKPRAPGPAGPVRRGAVQEAVFATIANKPEGMSRAEIVEAMGKKGDKTGEQSVSNALTALKKANKVASNDGKYLAGST